MKLLLVSCLCLLAVPALAQVGPTSAGLPNMSGNPSYGGGGSGLPHRSNPDDSQDSGKKDDKPAAPPPAIPGAVSDPDAPVVPADKLAAEMSPNDALFDAITRGDLAAAKDAVSRGAQLDAHNVLGQTPTDAAIDLNRNDITFLLLSLRTNVTASRPVQTASVQKPGKAKVVRASAKSATAKQVVAVGRGTPNPAVGFTGF